MRKNKLLIISIFIILLIIGLANADDFDNDGIPNEEDNYPYDFDNDGIPDGWEKKYNLDPEVYDSDKDPDNDGLTSLEEYINNTNPMEHNNQKDKELFSPSGTAKILIWMFILLFLGGIFLFFFYRKHIRSAFVYKPPKRKTQPNTRTNQRNLPQHTNQQYQAYQRQQAYRAYQERLRHQRLQQEYQKAMQQRRLQQMQQAQQRKSYVDMGELKTQDIFERVRNIK